MPDTRYARSGDVNIAYQVVGEGKLDLVFVSGWISNVELAWEQPTLEQRMDDVRAVMDAAGSDRAALFGISEGGPLCILFAATYPDRTVALVTCGTYAKRVWSPDYPWAPTPEDRQQFYDAIEYKWGRSWAWTPWLPACRTTRPSGDGSRPMFAAARVRARPWPWRR